MGVNSLRTEGWHDVVASLFLTIMAVGFWYGHDLYLQRIVFVVGIGAGVLVYRAADFADRNPVAGFPITMLIILVMLATLYSRSLIAGTVAALVVVTALNVYDVYWKN